MGLLIGGLLPRGMLSADFSRSLMTFVGLVAASILPTITLLLNSMTAAGRSVLRVSALHTEMSDAVRALFGVFVLICLEVLVLALATFDIPAIPAFPEGPAFFKAIEQGVAFGLILAIATKAGHIPQVIFRLLDLRAEIALDEARRATLENAPPIGETGAAFPTREGFGRRVPLSEVKSASR